MFSENHLKYFVSVYNTHSISKSATALFMAPQGLSRTIKNMEQEIGTQLFQRNGNQMVPTQAADNLYLHAMKILSEYRYFSKDKLLSGNLTVYVIDDFFIYFTSNLIAEFYNLCPNSNLKIVSVTPDIAIKYLLNDECDVVIGQTDYPSPTLVNEFIISLNFGLLINKNNPLSAKECIEDSDFDGMILCGRGSDYPVFRNVIERLNSQGYYPNLIFESNNQKACASLAAANVAVASVSEFFIKKHNFDNCVFKKMDSSHCDNMYFTYKSGKENSLELQVLKKLVLQSTSHS